MSGLRGVKVGDTLERLVNVNGSMVPFMELVVTDIQGDRAVCGEWEFDIFTGAEVDDYLGYGPPPKVTGSIAKFATHPLEETWEQRTNDDKPEQRP